MNEKRLSGLMGLCARARQGVFGEGAAMNAMRGGEIGLLLLDETISAGMAEKLERLAGRTAVPVHRIPDGLLEAATGKPGMVMAVRKGGFAEQMVDCLA